MATLPVNELKEVIDLNEDIGSGAYGVVKLVSVHGTICAAKDVHKILLQHVSKRESTAVKEKFMQECVHCSKLLHPNIVQFLGTYYPSEDADLPWLIMEKLDCSLTDYVEKHKHVEIYFPVKVSIFNDVLLGLQYLHAQKIIHRDLSSNNILLTKFLVAKIADLGMAKLVDPSIIISQSKQPGTAVFMPPEALLDHSCRYNSSIDVFSFGCVMIHLMAQEFPNPESTMRLDKNIGKYVTFTQAECREKYLAKIHKPPELRKLILQSIDDIPDRRPNINELLKYFETFLKQQTSQGIFLDKDRIISKLQDNLFEKDRQLVEVQQTKDKLTLEVDQLKARVSRLSEEVARLMEVDQELVKAEHRIISIENELATKEFQLQVYKEDFEQERKDRENAHHIKEVEIQKVRVEQEALRAKHHENIKAIHENYKGQMNTYIQKVTQLTKDNERLTQENARLQATLAKQKNEKQHDLKSNEVKPQSKEEAEKLLKVVPKNGEDKKGSDKPPEEANSNLYTNDYDSNQFQASIKNEETTSLQEFITKQLNAQRRLNQLLRAMDNKLIRKNSSVDPPTSIVRPSYQFQPQYQQQFPSLQSMNAPVFFPTNQQQSGYFPTMPPKYPPQHDPWPSSNVYNMPSWFHSRQPISISEGINEEIRIQAELQRSKQQHSESEYDAPFDPYLICHKCKRQFREGQLPEYRHHIDYCRQY